MVNLTVYGQTDVGCVRKSNEDALLIADLSGNNLIDEQKITRFEVGARGVLLAVSDGMGGQRAGEVASAMVIESMKRSMALDRQSQPPDALIQRAVERANREVWHAAATPGREGMGATVTALFVQGDAVHIAEVGDSRAYLLRGGVLHQVTRDQSYVQVLVDSGVMTPEQAETAPMKNVILQAMGQKSNVTVALGRLSLRQRDCFLICSDGLSNMVSPDEMRHVILTATRLDAACATLIQLAKSHGGEDNITVIIGGVSGDLPPLVPGEPITDTLEVLKEFGAPAPSGA
ncbi:MAG: Stp1/IreP family PP2C-type Ser/Thr phosphatase [Polyangiales bacterium]